MKKAIASILIASTLSTPVLAWGDREQGALLGLVIGGVVASQQAEQRQPRVVYPQQQIIVQPVPQICGYSVYCGPTSCYQQPVWNQWGQVIGYQTVCK